MNKIKNNTKKATKDLIISLDYLNSGQKEEWLRIVDTLNQKQINEVFEHFQIALKEDEDMQLKNLYKAKMGDQYKSIVKEISNKYKNKARKKEEAYKTKKEKSPEDILNKLNEV